MRANRARSWLEARLPAVENSQAEASGEAVADRLIRLARSRHLDDRRRLLMGVVDLCEAAPEGGKPAREVMADVFLTLVTQAERDIRKALAERLADADWAPRSLVNVLALDEIEIARPIIARSPLLRDQDLLRVLVEATIEHQIEVARRPHVGATVVDAILDRGEPCVLTALAGNTTAEISEPGMRRLIQASRRIAALRAPLVRHPSLNSQLAQDLYAWVGQALREAIGERFRVDDAALAQAVGQAVRSAQQPPVEPGRPATVDAERDEMERRLIAKLDAAGQLRPGYLVRAAREGRLSLFENALAMLGGYSVADVRRATAAESPAALAMACNSVGIDRVVFPTLVAAVRRQNGGRPSGQASATDILALFAAEPEESARAFRQHMAAVSVAA